MSLDLLRHSLFAFLLGDGNFCSLRWTSAQPVLVEARARSPLTIIEPFCAPLWGSAFFWMKKYLYSPHRSLWGTSLRDWAPSPPVAHFTPGLLPPASHPLSPRGGKQQPPWCCRKDKETNCECLCQSRFIAYFNGTRLDVSASTQDYASVFACMPASKVSLQHKEVAKFFTMQTRGHSPALNWITIQTRTLNDSLKTQQHSPASSVFSQHSKPHDQTWLALVLVLLADCLQIKDEDEISIFNRVHHVWWCATSLSTLACVRLL